MAHVAPLSGWRYDSTRLSLEDVTAPGDLSQQVDPSPFFCKHPRNIVRLLTPRWFDTDTKQENKYTRAAGHLDAWLEERCLLQDGPSAYVLRETFGTKRGETVRSGVLLRVCLPAVPEKITTSKCEPKADDVNMLRALRGHVAPVTALVRGAGALLQEFIDASTDGVPLLCTPPESNSSCALWQVSREESVSELTAALSAGSLSVVAGIDRLVAALTYRDQVRERIALSGQTAPPLGGLASDYIPTLLIAEDDPGLDFWPLHRLLARSCGLSSDSLYTHLESNFDIEPFESQDQLMRAMHDLDATGHCIGLALGGGLFLLTQKEANPLKLKAPLACTAWIHMDTAAFEVLVEEPLGLSNSIRFLSNTEEALQAGLSGADETLAAFLVRPPKASQILDVAEAEQHVPHHSIHLQPVPPAGLVMDLFR